MSLHQGYKREISVLLTGSMGSGKTSLLHRLEGRGFSEEYHPTEWFDSYTVPLQVDDESDEVMLLIMDADGTRKYESYSINYYATSDVTVFVYDISDQTSMESVTQINKDIKKYCKYEGKEPCRIFVGNKCDKSRKINRKDAENFAEENNIPYIETSAKTNENVKEMFKLVVKRYREMKSTFESSNTDEMLPIPATTTPQKSEPPVTSTENSTCSCTIC